MGRNDCVITLKVLWELALSKWLTLLLAASVVTGLWWSVEKLTFSPQYASVTTLYVLEQTGEDAYSQAMKVVEDCRYMVTSHTVLADTIEKLGLETDAARLRKQISANNPEDTRILEVTVTASTPEEAKRVADGLCDVATEKICATLGRDQIHVYEAATLPLTPCNTPQLQDYILIFVATAVLAYTLLLLNYLRKRLIANNQ